MRNIKKVLALTLMVAMAVSSVSSNGTIEAKGKKAKKVKSVKLTKPKKSITMKVGSSLKIKATVKTKGKGVSKKLVYKSTKTKVVKVTKKGKMKALKVGKAKVKVMAKANKKKKVVISVKVVKKNAGTDSNSTAAPSASAATASASASASAAVAVASASSTPVASSATNSATPATKKPVVTPAVKTMEPDETPNTDPYIRAKDGYKRVHNLTIEDAETNRNVVNGETTVTFVVNNSAEDVLSEVMGSTSALLKKSAKKTLLDGASTETVDTETVSTETGASTESKPVETAKPYEPGGSFILGFGSHSATADFTIKDVVLTFDDGTTEVPLKEGAVVSKGGVMTLMEGGLNFVSSHKYYGMTGVLCTIPAGKKPSDIKSITYSVSAKDKCMMCLYAGDYVDGYDGMKEITSCTQGVVTDKIESIEKLS